MKKWLKKRLIGFIEWFIKTRLFKKPRLWEKKEWDSISPREKIWVWYKHHLYIKGLGSAEVDQVTTPTKEIILYGSVIILAVERLYAIANISVSAEQLIYTVGTVCVLLWVGNTVIQWVIGNQLDNLDLPAWDCEISNRRNKVFREIRKTTEKEDWRKAKVN